MSLALVCSAEEPVLGPDFYEFTADDYARLMAGRQLAGRHAEAGLRTAKLREDEMRMRAMQIGSVPVRVTSQMASSCRWRLAKGSVCRPC